MSFSVRDCTYTGQPACHRQEFRVSSLPQASSALGHVLSSQDVLLTVLLVLVLVAGLVVFPAVWSSKPSRRKAALAVLDRIIRWRW